MTYSLDFRQKVFEQKAKHDLTFEQTSERFGIGIATLFRWQKKLIPCKTRNRSATKINDDQLLEDVKNHPDDYQWERAERFAVTQRAIGLALKRLGISYKKTLEHPKANEEARIAFQQKILAYEQEGKTIVYVDESGFAKDMPRTHGYAKRGNRCFGTHNWHSKGRVNAIGAIIDFVFVAVGLFSGSINSDVFYAWLTSTLLPSLQAGTVIVMDNASFHKRADMIEAINDHGCILEFLPPYSPDLNPIEHKWAQAKAIRKKLRCDDIDVLFSEHINYIIL